MARESSLEPGIGWGVVVSAYAMTCVVGHKKVDIFLGWGDIVMILSELCILPRKLMSPKLILLNCGIGGAVFMSNARF
jgi:hypothetical protein